MTTIPSDINNLVEITLADGVKRHLRFSLGARKRICEKFGKEPTALLSAPPEELIPFVLMEGIVERDGISIESLMEGSADGTARSLIDARMTDEVLLKFIDSFFVPKVAQNLKRVLDAVNLKSEQALRSLESENKQQTPPASPTILQ